MTPKKSNKIIVGEKIEGRNIVSMVMNDYHGMKDCVDHLIEVHGCKKICFLSGSPKIVNARHRLAAYQEGIIKQADGKLYEDKKKRRKNVIRV